MRRNDNVDDPPKNRDNMNTVLLVVSAALADWLYLVGLALDLFWLKLLTKPWLVVARASR